MSAPSIAAANFRPTFSWNDRSDAHSVFSRNPTTPDTVISTPSDVFALNAEASDPLPSPENVYVRCPAG